MRKSFIRRLVAFGLTVLFVVAGSILPLAGQKVQAQENYSANVVLTLPDQSKLVNAEPDVTFNTNLVPQPNELSVRIDPTKTYQTMDGVGAAMTESSAYNFSTKLTANQRALVFYALFDKNHGGMDVVRVPWGLTDFSLDEYTYNENPPGGTDEPQNNFSITHDLQHLIPRLQDARTVNPNLKLIMAPWSAPLWMKGVPFPDRPYAVGPLLDQYYDSYGTYLIKAINDYAGSNLTPHAFSTQNEPFTPTFNASMLFNVDNHKRLIRDNVGPKVATNQIQPQLLAHDEDWQDERDTTNPMYALNMLADPNAAQHIDGVAYHCYHGESTRQLLVQKTHPDKNIYVTECTGSNTPAENWDDDFRWGMRNMVINPIRNYAKSSIYWNLALDENAGPKTFTNAGCQNCRGIMTLNSNGSISFNNEYYILAHYGRFVRPGAQRIDSSTYGEGAVETVAFKNTDGSKALIALNSGSTPRTFTVREGNAAFRYTLPAGAAASFKWSMPDNTTQDIDNSRIEAEGYSSSLPAGAQIIDIVDEGKHDRAARILNDQELRFNSTAFLGGNPVSFQMRYRTLGSGTVEFRQDSASGPLLASIPFAPTDWQSSAVTTGTVMPQAGTHTLYVILKHPANTFIDLNWLKFAENPTGTGQPVAGKSTWKAYGVFGGGADVPGNVLDGDNDNRWTTGWPMTYGHWFVLDAGKQIALNGLGAYSAGGDRPRHLKIEVSDNGIDYKTAVADYVPTADLYFVPFTERMMGRYVRLTELSENNIATWWSMNEINLYNN